MQPTPPKIPAAGRFIGAAVGFVFAAIGLTVIGFLWFGFDDDFGSPPLFFRIFGSLIAIVFVLVGGGTGLAALTAELPAITPPVPPTPTTPTPPPVGSYACPHCGAALTSKTEASPHGDIKCPFCGAWFNIHTRIP